MFSNFLINFDFDFNNVQRRKLTNIIINSIVISIVNALINCRHNDNNNENSFFDLHSFLFDYRNNNNE